VEGQLDGLRPLGMVLLSVWDRSAIAAAQLMHMLPIAAGCSL
jgi:hypothetical protein